MMRDFVALWILIQVLLLLDQFFLSEWNWFNWLLTLASPPAAAILIAIANTRLQPGDVLLVSELSRLGRSIEEVIHITNSLVGSGVRLIAIKQGLDVREHDMASKVITTIFGLLAELERDLISTRTRMALAARKAAGVQLGRPKGSTSTSKLDDRRETISELLKHRVAKSAIARMMGVSRSNLSEFIKSRGM